VVRLQPAERIEQRITQWRSEAGKRPPPLPALSRRAESEYRQAAEKLGRAVWDPLLPHLRGVRQLFVVPDGSLHLVSFGTLPVGEEDYVVDVGPIIHYLSAERDLVRPHKRGATGRGMLALGAPLFDAAPGDLGDQARVAHPPTAAAYRGPRAACIDLSSLRFEPLPSSGIEAREIEALWTSASARREGEREARLLTGAAASEPAFKASAGGRRILHIATHSFFEPLDCRQAGGHRPGENPLLLSGLALAGANRRQEVKSPADGEDGILTAEEIASLDLSGVEWAVLSACETGVGRVQSGEGVLGLRRAFEVAGADTLIMSLWPVEDAATREWMHALYSGRLQGLSTTEALHRAALETRRARRDAGRDGHPFFWGAFVAAGDWR
jgi:CHAT domain-containing protein